MLDFKAFAEDMARETFTRAASKPVTHWSKPVELTHSQEFDPRGSSYADCGAKVTARQITQHGARPTCPKCADLFDEDEQTLRTLTQGAR